MFDLSFSRLCVNFDTNTEDSHEDLDNLDDFEIDDFEKNLYYAHFKNLADQASLDETGPANNFLSKTFLDYMLKYVFPYCCMWSSFVESTQSNAVVENFFGFLKCELFVNSLHQKPGRFISGMRNFIDAKIKEIEYDFPKNKKANSKIKQEQKRSAFAENLNETEKWSKKVKSENHYLKKTTYVFSQYVDESPTSNTDEDVKSRSLKILRKPIISGSTQLWANDYVFFSKFNFLRT